MLHRMTFQHKQKNSLDFISHLQSIKVTMLRGLYIGFRYGRDRINFVVHLC